MLIRILIHLLFHINSCKHDLCSLHISMPFFADFMMLKQLYNSLCMFLLVTTRWYNFSTLKEQISCPTELESWQRCCQFCSWKLPERMSVLLPQLLEASLILPLQASLSALSTAAGFPSFLVIAPIRTLAFRKRALTYHLQVAMIRIHLQVHFGDCEVNISFERIFSNKAKKART